MKNLLVLITCSLLTLSSYGYTTVFTKKVTATSNRSCADANSKLSRKLDQRAQRTNRVIVKVKLNPCTVKAIVRNNKRYSQNAQIQYEVNQAQGNY